uniref:Uncharacterized protein n=1 Tax=Trichuris muris TaxID=70415 RepID=A0A5S6Q6J6_TRIMR
MRKNIYLADKRGGWSLVASGEVLANIEQMKVRTPLWALAYGGRFGRSAARRAAQSFYRRATNMHVGGGGDRKITIPVGLQMTKGATCHQRAPGFGVPALGKVRGQLTEQLEPDRSSSAMLKQRPNRRRGGPATLSVQEQLLVSESSPALCRAGGQQGADRHGCPFFCHKRPT